jgi:glyoxylase-like metal-dependent hydrolase (beta-lactamase superfamily II)
MKEGDVFDLGGKKIEIVLMPGHTPGSIILLDKADGVCYSGDAFGSGQVWLQLQPHLPMKTYLESCERMEKIIDEQHITDIYCGHYPHVKRAFHKDYVTRMKQLAQRLVAGNPSGAVTFTGRRGEGDTSMMISDGDATIVYRPEFIFE